MSYGESRQLEADIPATPPRNDPIVAAVSELVSAVRKDGTPAVRMRCADYGTECVVECDLYPAGEPAAVPTTTGPFVFGTVGEARSFVETSLLALQILGCDVS
jgi:hypothetical protein